ncbi:two-component system response regulator [Fusobacterium necrophorum subsp. funduliforme]|uniref:Transcriptional regulatory protein, C-terminal domain protein n=2 Tax=Fusobacterium necrophorum TaxID=859 RepID=A0AAN3VWN7_9FUSO|nr:response regulator transcription factor [Fusobacterium necrophorum]AYV95279.1 DNA-binding response regulator [Fusobacterium necrophorum subsp. funduliforme]EFS23842.1 response regulator receiver domain protein [Fusobacterium necrophorum D12]EJU18521.1 transcriptional regulatory protein, C-terminal domain protein [Fusobacterium necrophorum subsp. funduliforme Fnf 1007]KYL00009.1 two-component system response regulator [Fusobacterium necrophorum subsp. funduliforme]KYL01617.1 two-component sy
MNILLIQRKQEFAKELKIAWKEQGNIVDIAGNYESALQFFYAGNYDIVLLDTWIKGGDAFLLAEKIRERSRKIGLIFLSEDTGFFWKKRAFEVGADAYLLPNSVEEVSLQVFALGRRVKAEAEYRKHRYVYADMEVDLLQRKVFREGKDLNFTEKEFLLLSLLLKNQGLALHRDMIRKEVWGADFQGASNIVESYIKQIRKKLQDKEYHWIKTIRGYGYGIDERKGE